MRVMSFLGGRAVAHVSARTTTIPTRRTGRIVRGIDENKRVGAPDYVARWFARRRVRL